VSCEYCKHYKNSVWDLAGYCTKDLKHTVTPEGVAEDRPVRTAYRSLKRFRKHNNGVCPYFKRRGSDPSLLCLYIVMAVLVVAAILIPVIGAICCRYL